MEVTRYVVLYKPDPNSFSKAGELFPAHTQHFTKFQEQGTLLSFGAFADLVKHGSMGIFTSKEAAEAFVKGDPFVQHGVVATHEIREWNLSVA